MGLRIVRCVSPVLLVVLACGAYRLTVRPAAAARIAQRNVPWNIAPRYDIPLVATDEQLASVLDRMKPASGQPNTNVLVHALRLWGPRADFHDAAFVSGQEMLAYFLDDAAFQKLAGSDAPPLFARGDGGVQARPWKEADRFHDTSAVHVDDLLATLAECGTPLDQTLWMRDGEATVGDLLQDSLRRFRDVQLEFEWSALSYVRYAFPAKSWTNEYGQTVTLDELLNDLIDRPLPNGVCGGTHRIEALVVLLRADDQIHALSRRQRQRITEHLAGVTRLLMQSQHLDGHWSRSWYRGMVDDKPGDLADAILLTGHHLEWLALAPPEVQPPRETIVRAGQWTVRAMQEVSAAELSKYYGPLSHAARALCLWRSMEPHDAWLAGRNAAE